MRKVVFRSQESSWLPSNCLAKISPMIPFLICFQRFSGRELATFPLVALDKIFIYLFFYCRLFSWDFFGQ